MSQWTVIIKNNLNSDFEVTDLGYVVEKNITVNLSDLFSYTDLVNSDDLRNAISSGDLIVNDGSQDLNIAEGVQYLILINKLYLSEYYYNQYQLETSGESEVHWDNISGVPAFGAPNFINPVKYRVLGIGLSEVERDALPALEGDFVVADTNIYYRFDGTIWVNSTVAAATEDRVINLGEAVQGIFVFNAESGGSWTGAEPDPDLLGSTVIVANDGDTKAAQYIYDSTVWKKIADVDFREHFDGGADKHDASEVTVEGNYPNIDVSAETGLESAVGAVDAKLGLLSEDDAKRQIVEGTMYLQDASRDNKWISVERITLIFGRAGNSKNMYLNFGGGSLPSLKSGLRMMRDAVLLGLAGQLDGVGSCDFEIRRNDSVEVLESLSLSSETGAQKINCNYDLNQGDAIQAYISSVSTVSDPMLVVEIAWRCSSL